MIFQTGRLKVTIFLALLFSFLGFINFICRVGNADTYTETMNPHTGQPDIILYTISGDRVSVDTVSFAGSLSVADDTAQKAFNTLDDAIGGGTPASPANSVQFNNSGAFGGHANLTWNNSAETLWVNGTLYVPTLLRVGSDATAILGNNGGIDRFAIYAGREGQAQQINWNLNGSMSVDTNSTAGAFWILDNGTAIITMGSDTVDGDEIANYVLNQTHFTNSTDWGDITVNATNVVLLESNYKQFALHFTIDGGGAAITAGAKSWMRCPFNGTLEGWEMTSDVNTNTTIDVWRDIYANYPPTDADNITGSGKECNITNAVKNQDTGITDWTNYNITNGDYIKINVDSTDNAQDVYLTIWGNKTQ